jgi:hypothetical protein
MAVLVVVGAVVALAALAILVVSLPWECRIRWVVAMNTTPDPWCLGATPHVPMEEVRVARQAGGDVYVVPRIGRSEVLTGVDHDERRWLDQWAQARTPVLRVVHPDDGVSLHGPAHAILGLRTRASTPVATRSAS